MDLEWFQGCFFMQAWELQQKIRPVQITGCNILKKRKTNEKQNSYFLFFQRKTEQKVETSHLFLMDLFLFFFFHRFFFWFCFSEKQKQCWCLEKTAQYWNKQNRIICLSKKMFLKTSQLTNNQVFEAPWWYIF